jgi:secreted trypsin-like serine protease
MKGISSVLPLLLLASLVLTGCGLSNQASLNLPSPEIGLVQGKPVAPNDWIANSTVGLVLKGQSADEHLHPSICSATLIHEKIIITAAHCVSVFEDGLVVFSTDLRSPMAPQTRRILQVLIHPKYALDQPEGSATEESELHDLALVLFEGELPPGYQPIEVLTDESKLKFGVRMTFAGYGMTSPQGLDSPNHDKGILGQTTIKFGAFHEDTSDLYFPAPPDGASVCNGDSGGSVYLQVENRWVLAGVISRGQNQSCRSYSIATNTAAHMPFIKKGISRLLSGQRP